MAGKIAAQLSCTNVSPCLRPNLTPLFLTNLAEGANSSRQTFWPNSTDRTRPIGLDRSNSTHAGLKPWPPRRCAQAGIWR